MPRYSVAPVGPFVVETLTRDRFEAIYGGPRGGSMATADRDWYDPLIPDLHLPESKPIDTGLLDVRGHRIMREPNPLGFGRDGEW